MFLSRPLLLAGSCVAAVLAIALGVGSLAQAQPASRASANTAYASPAWSQLSPEQRTALAPLARTWDQFNEGHKRKWIVLAQNFSHLSPAEQAKLRSRMTEWAALSPRQRTDARLNFGELQRIPPDDKKAKWEAYQALSPEEKRKLAAGASRKPPATAAAVKPVPAQKLTTVPRPGAPGASKQQRIVLDPAAVSAPSPQPAPAVSSPP